MPRLPKDGWITGLARTPMGSFLGALKDRTAPELTRQPLYLDGPPQWHCLRVMPQREDDCEAWLDRRGVYAFHPVTVRYETHKGQRIKRVSRFIPGYVFARFPGRINWHAVHASPLVADAIRMRDGRIAALAECDLTALRAMSDRERRERERKAAAQMIRLGDRVRVSAGPFEGADVEVITLKAGRARFEIRMFGIERMVEAPVGGLVKV